jgi:peptide/nickel transport system permease protein
VLTILGVATIVFVATRLVPGSFAEAFFGPALAASPELADQLEARYGLDRPLPVQYGLWLRRVIQGDLGSSLLSGASVSSEIVRRGGLTVELAVLATAVSVAIGVPAGVLAALRRGSAVDAGLRAAALAGLSIPSFSLGTLLIYVVSTRDLGLPVAGYVPVREDVVRHLQSLLLPTVVLGAITTAIVMRTTRSSVAEVLAEPFVTTARAKGLSHRIVIWRHVLLAALIPVVTVIGINMGYLLSGAVIVEQLFSLPGLGRYALEGINARDYPAAQGAVLVAATMFVLTGLAVDVLYAYLDPRINR